jgi:putative membrane protein
MIVRDRPTGLALFFIMRGSILPAIWKVLLLNIIIAIFVTVGHGTVFHEKVTLTTIPFSLIGLALAIFLGFRNSAAYDRYWESRKLWGQLVAASRDLSRQCRSMIRSDLPIQNARRRSGMDDVRVRMTCRAIAFAHALRMQLRMTNPSSWTDFEGLLTDVEIARLGTTSSNTNFLMNRMGEDLRTCLAEQRLDAFLAATIDSTLCAMVAVATGCERIKNTPIPFSYTLLLHRTAYIYCFLLPFGLVDTIGFMTPVVVAIVAYTFFGLDAVGDEITEPFGMSSNHLPLNAICRTIEIDMLESLGDADIPPPLAAMDFQLT